MKDPVQAAIDNYESAKAAGTLKILSSLADLESQQSDQIQLNSIT